MKKKLNEAIELQEDYIKSLKAHLDELAIKAKAGSIRAKDAAHFYRDNVQKANKVLRRLKSIKEKMEA